MSEGKDDFDFYLKFGKQLVLNLSNVKDRIIAAAWVQKLRDESAGAAKLRTDYLKLLIFSMQRKRLVGPFAHNPTDLPELEELPENLKLLDLAKLLIEHEQKDNEQKRLRGAHNPPVTGECSSNMLEYAATQDIPNFGVQAFYAISTKPVHTWSRLNNAVIPKQDVCTKGKGDLPCINVTQASEKDSRRSGTGGGEEPNDEEKEEEEECAPRRPVPSPVSVLGDKSEDEEELRQPPTWGSNLLTVEESNAIDEDYENLADIGLGELNVEGLDLCDLEKDLDFNVDDFMGMGDEECADEGEAAAGAAVKDLPEANYDIKFGVMEDEEFDNYVLNLQREEDALLAEIEQLQKGGEQPCRPERDLPTLPEFKSPCPPPKQPCPPPKSPCPPPKSPCPPPAAAPCPPPAAAPCEDPCAKPAKPKTAKRKTTKTLKKPCASETSVSGMGAAQKMKAKAEDLALKTSKQVSRIAKPPPAGRKTAKPCPPEPVCDLVKKAKRQEAELMRVPLKPRTKIPKFPWPKSKDAIKPKSMKQEMEYRDLCARLKRQEEELLCDQPVEPIEQGSNAARDIIDDANLVISKDTHGKKRREKPKPDLKYQGMSVRRKVEEAVQKAKKAMQTSAAHEGLPVTLPPTSPIPERFSNLLGDAEYNLDDELLDMEALDLDVQPLSSMHQAQMECPLVVSARPRTPDLQRPSTSRIPSPVYNAPRYTPPPVTRKGKSLARGKTRRKTSRKIDVEPCDSEDLRQQGNVQPTHVAEEASEPCRTPERIIPGYQYETPPELTCPPAARPASPCDLERIAASTETMLSSETADLYESPSPETCARQAETSRRALAREKLLFDETPEEGVCDNLDQEQLDYEECLPPEEAESLEYMSEVRQHPGKGWEPPCVPLAEQRQENLRKRQNLAAFPQVAPWSRGKTTQRTYAIAPKVDTVKEYYEGPCEPVYQSPRRRVPPVYPTVMTPPSAEKEPDVWPEARRHETKRPPRQAQPPCQYDDDEDMRTPTKRPHVTRASMRPKKLNFDECEEEEEEEPCQLREELYKPETLERMRKANLSSSFSERQIMETLRNEPRPENMIAFRGLGEYSYYMSPPKRTPLDEDVPQAGLGRPLVPYEWGWKSPPGQYGTPDMCVGPSSTGLLPSPQRGQGAARAANAGALDEEEFPYSDWPPETCDAYAPSSTTELLDAGNTASAASVSETPSVDQQLTNVENLIEEYQRDADQQQQNLCTTPPRAHQRKVLLQRKLFNTFNELDDLMDDSAVETYSEPDASPLSQPLNLYRFRERVRKDTGSTMQDKEGRRRNLANAFGVALREDVEGERLEAEEQGQGSSSASVPPPAYTQRSPLPADFDYLNTLRLEDMEDDDECSFFS